MRALSAHGFQQDLLIRFISMPPIQITSTSCAAMLILRKGFGMTSGLTA